MIVALILRLPNFFEVFKIECDTSRISIDESLSQERYLIAFLSEKLNKAKRRYSTYIKEFYAIVETLRY